MSGAPRLNLARSAALFEEAQALVPGGPIYARKPPDFLPGEYPIFFESGQGCRITDVDGNEFIDFLCGYGPVLLGHREPEVDEAVIRQITDKGLCLTFTQPIQNRLAARLKELIPSAELSLIMKTGSDATSAAVRVARAHTGRVTGMRCGYHGWHEWCVELKGGVPLKLYEDVFDFRYNDLEELEALMRKHGDATALIIMTPIGHATHRRMEEPLPGFLEGVRALADRYGAVLAFDEIRTNFRLGMGGAQERYGVLPDLTVLGKGMGNGYAVSALAGRARVMAAAAQETFISSTFFPNSDGMAGAIKVLEILERDKVPQALWRTGERFLAGIQGLLDRYDVGAELSGLPPMFFITFRRDRTGAHAVKRDAFYTQLIRRGIFLSPHHHGYLCARHDDEALDRAAKAIEESLRYVRETFGAEGRQAAVHPQPS